LVGRLAPQPGSAEGCPERRDRYGGGGCQPAPLPVAAQHLAGEVLIGVDVLDRCGQQRGNVVCHELS